MTESRAAYTLHTALIFFLMKNLHLELRGCKKLLFAVQYNLLVPQGKVWPTSAALGTIKLS